MKARDVAQEYNVAGRDTVVTYDQVITHKTYGEVRKVIHRKTGNDSGLKTRMTKELLMSHEPNVGNWPGDVIEIFDEHGELLEREVF